jgi:hypothetical protein
VKTVLTENVVTGLEMPEKESLFILHEMTDVQTLIEATL